VEVERAAEEEVGTREKRQARFEGHADLIIGASLMRCATILSIVLVRF
jgi:hypothetical protein